MTTRPGYVWDATASEWVEIGQAAVVAPIAYQTSAPSSPATGDIWIDSDDDVPSVDSTLYYRWTKTMSGGETSLSGADNNSLALKYTPGYESVFINGVLQVRGSDYVATTGTTVTGLIALTASDVVMVESIVAYSVGDTYTQSQISSLLDAKSPVSTTGLVLLNTTTFTAQASVSIDNVFTSTYNYYQLVFDSVYSSGSQAINLRGRINLTDIAGTAYDCPGVTLSRAGAFTNIGVNGGSAARIGTTSTTDDTFINAEFTTTGNNLFFKFYGFSAIDTFAFGGGKVAGANPITGFTVYPASGTMTGTIKVYGYK